MKTNDNDNRKRTKFAATIVKRRNNTANSSSVTNADDGNTSSNGEPNERNYSEGRSAGNGNAIGKDNGGITSGGSGRHSGRGNGIGAGSGSAVSGRNRSDVTATRRGRRTSAERIAARAEELLSTDDVVEVNGVEELNEATNPAIAEALAEQRPKRKRRTKAEMVQDNSPIEPGVTASAMLLGGLIQGLSETAALSFNNPIYRLNQAESKELGGAALDCLNTLPKSARKKFDKIFQQYFPFWNLAVVATKIIYPRYQYAKLMKEQDAGNIQEESEETKTETIH